MLTTFNQSANRVAMHAVRRELIEAQAACTGLPLWAIDLPWPCSNAEYETRMRAACGRAIAEQFDAVAFGDLFLEDVRQYRLRQLAETNLEPIFPIWKLPTAQLAREMLAQGVKAKLTCIDPSKLDRSFAGREYDDKLLANLPPEVDPCGENGEFHTFVYDSPVFSSPIPVKMGKIVERDSFVFADVLPL